MNRLLLIALMGIFAFAPASFAVDENLKTEPQKPFTSEYFPMEAHSYTMNSMHTNRYYHARTFSIKNNWGNAYIASANYSNCKSGDQLIAQYNRNPSSYYGMGSFGYAFNNQMDNQLLGEVSGVVSSVMSPMPIPLGESITFTCYALKYENASMRFVLTNPQNEMLSLSLNAQTPIIATKFFERIKQQNLSY